MKSYILLLPVHLITGYLFQLCFTDPNPIPLTKPDKTLGDGLISQIVSKIQCTTLAFGPWLFSLYAITLTLLRASHSPHFATLCPLQPEQVLDPTPTMALAFIMVFVFGFLRLECYRKLGECFQYHVQSPPKLIEDGVYRYVRHPSYTCAWFMVVAAKMLFQDRNGILGCVVASREENLLDWAALVWIMVYIGFRVKHEEEVLMETFGKKWVVYAKERARFIPGIF